MPRSIKPWHSDNHDAKIPQRVQLRVFERDNRTCFLCGQPIRTSDGLDFHHRTPLIDGGEHSEANLVPVHRKCHRLQTAREAHERAEARAKVKHHYGIKKPSQIKSRGFGKAPAQRNATRPINKWAAWNPINNGD